MTSNFKPINKLFTAEAYLAQCDRAKQQPQLDPSIDSETISKTHSVGKIIQEAMAITFNSNSTKHCKIDLSKCLIHDLSSELSKLDQLSKQSHISKGFQLERPKTAVSLDKNGNRTVETIQNLLLDMRYYELFRPPTNESISPPISEQQKPSSTIESVLSDLSFLSQNAPESQFCLFNIQGEEHHLVMQNKLAQLGFRVQTSSFPHLQFSHLENGSIGVSFERHLVVRLPDHFSNINQLHKHALPSDYLSPSSSDPESLEYWNELVQCHPFTHLLDNAQKNRIATDCHSSIDDRINPFYLKLSTFKTFEELIDLRDVSNLSATDLSNYLIYPAIVAMLKGAITQMQCATICYFCSAVDQLLFNPKQFGEKINDEGEKEYQEITEPRNDSPPKAPPHLLNLIELERSGNKLFQMVASEFNFSPDEFLNILKTLPHSEQFVLSIPLSPTNIHSKTWSPLIHAINKLGTKLPFFMLSEHEKGADSKIIQGYLFAISFSVIELFMKKRHHLSCMDMQPLIGNCKAVDLRKARQTGRRIVQLGAAFAPCPSTADSYLSGGNFAFTLHDIYHLIRDSLVLENERAVIIDLIVPFLTNLLRQERDPFKQEALKKILRKLGDGELHQSNLRYDPDKGRDLFGKLFAIRDFTFSPIRLQIRNEILKQMVRESRNWLKYGLLKNSLLSSQQVVYEAELLR